MDLAARAWQTAFVGMVDSVPGGCVREGSRGSTMAFSGAPVAELNGVLNATADPDVDEIATLAASAEKESERTGVPWSIQVRAEPMPDLVRVAADHGLTVRSRHPFMVRPLDDAAAPPDRAGSLPIRRIDGTEHEVFAAALAAGFEVPLEVMSVVTVPPLLDGEGVTSYLAELDGVPVCTGLGALTDGCLGLFNISTPPEYRRRGHGREMVEAILRDGRAAGARLAYLHSSASGLHLYETLGFRTVEQWTYFTPPE